MSNILLSSLNFCFIPFSIWLFKSNVATPCVLKYEFGFNSFAVKDCLFNSSANSDGPSSNSIFLPITSFIKSFHTRLNVPHHTLFVSVDDNLLVFVGVIFAFPFTFSIIFIVAYVTPDNIKVAHKIIIHIFKTLFISSNPFFIKILYNSFLPLWIRFLTF